MAVGAGLSLLPDADVIGFAFGVRYGDAWGHRGATHSLAFALLVGLAAGAAAVSPPARRRGAAALVACGVVASHGLLDALTDGGLGCALLWPLSEARYFAPWRPIPVAPIGLGFVSVRGARVALVELAMFSPLWSYALWPRRGSVPARAGSG